MDREATNPARRGAFLQDLWLDIRPYILCLVKDWLIATTMWTLLWLFKKLTSIAPIVGWAGEFMVNLHAVGTVMVYGIFVSMLVWDIVDLYRKKGKGSHV
jgi:hypothetical protein